MVIHTTLAEDEPLYFRKNLLEELYKLIMGINNKIRDEKLQYDTYREAAKVLVLSPGKIEIKPCLLIKVES